jgi:serine/threonine protein kinase
LPVLDNVHDMEVTLKTEEILLKIARRYADCITIFEANLQSSSIVRQCYIQKILMMLNKIRDRNQIFDWLFTQALDSKDDEVKVAALYALVDLPEFKSVHLNQLKPSVLQLIRSQYDRFEQYHFLSSTLLLPIFEFLAKLCKKGYQGEQGLFLEILMEHIDETNEIGKMAQHEVNAYAQQNLFRDESLSQYINVYIKALSNVKIQKQAREIFEAHCPLRITQNLLKQMADVFCNAYVETQNAVYLEMLMVQLERGVHHSKLQYSIFLENNSLIIDVEERIEVQVLKSSVGETREKQIENIQAILRRSQGEQFLCVGTLLKQHVGVINYQAYHQVESIDRRGLRPLVIHKLEIELIKKEGEGKFGQVWKARWQDMIIAYKQLMSDGDDGDQQFKEDFYREVEILQKARHPNVVSLLRVTIKPYAIVMEFAEKGSLYQVIKDEKNTMHREVCCNIAYDIAKGLEFLHFISEPVIIHRDLKSPNILLDKDYHAKLGDFGLSKIKGAISTLRKHEGHSLKGTVRWLAPEIISPGCNRVLEIAESTHTSNIIDVYTKESDVYSYGVILWEIITKELPYKDAHDDGLVMAWIIQHDLELESIPKDASLGLRSLSESCRSFISNKRPRINDICDKFERWKCSFWSEKTGKSLMDDLVVDKAMASSGQGKETQYENPQQKNSVIKSVDYSFD